MQGEYEQKRKEKRQLEPPQKPYANDTNAGVQIRGWELWQKHGLTSWTVAGWACM